MTALLALGLPLLGKLLPFLIAAIAGFAALWRYGASKKAQGHDEAMQQVTQANQQAQSEIANDVKSNAALSDGDLDKRLSDPDPGHP